MKKLLITLSPIGVIFIVYVILLETSKIVNEDSFMSGNNVNTEKSIVIPVNIQKVIDNSCIGCHNTKSKNKKGKMKLDFDKMTNGDYSVGKTSSKLRGIIKELNEKKMPPEKFLNKYPERAISSEEAKLLVDWAKEQGKALKH